jgi:tetratricopeptide (TPR) repeat protein
MSKDLKNKVHIALQILRGEEKYDLQTYGNPLEAAESLLKKVLMNNREQPEAWAALGLCYSYLPTRYPEALLAYKESMRFDISNPSIHYQIGNLFVLSGERGLENISRSPYNDALPFLFKAEKLNYEPKSELLNLIGKCYFRLSDYQNAVLFFEKSIACIDANVFLPSAFFLAAEASEKLADYSKAIEMYQKYMKYFGNFNSEGIPEKIGNLRLRLQAQVGFQGEVE